MKRAFDMIDEDNSGVIDAEELQGAAVALGIPMEALKDSPWPPVPTFHAWQIEEIDRVNDPKWVEENISVLLGTDKINFDEFFKSPGLNSPLRPYSRPYSIFFF